MSDSDTDTDTDTDTVYTDYTGYVDVGGDKDVNIDTNLDINIDVDYIGQRGDNILHDEDQFENINDVIDVDIHAENVSADITNLCKEAGIGHQFSSIFCKAVSMQSETIIQGGTQ